jgi:hypothetical protein
VSLKFCSREELRIRSSNGVVPDGYDAYASKELVVRCDWLMSAEAKKALKGRDAADKLDLKDVSVVVHGIVATINDECAAISNDAAGRTLFQAIDFVSVKCTTGDKNAVFWDTPGVPTLTLDAENPDAGDKLTLRQLDDVVNKFVFLWRDAGALVPQRKQVCDVVLHVQNFTGTRAYDKGCANELFAACGVFKAVERGLNAASAADEARSITTYHQLYAQVYGAPQVVVVYPKIRCKLPATLKLAELKSYLDEAADEESRDLSRTLASTIASLPLPSGADRAAAGCMALLGRHYAEFKEVLCLPLVSDRDVVGCERNRVRVTQERCADVLEAAAKHWRNVALFRASIHLCHEQARAHQGGTRNKTVAAAAASADFMQLTDELLALLTSVNLDESLDESLDEDDFNALRERYVKMAIANAREVATELAVGERAPIVLMELFDSNIGGWVKASVAELDGQLRAVHDEELFAEAMDSFLSEEPVKWVSLFRDAAHLQQQHQQHCNVLKACERLIDSLEQEIGCLTTAADVFAPLARKANDPLEIVKGDDDAHAASLMDTSAGEMALDDDDDDDDQDAAARIGKRKLSSGGREKKARIGLRAAAVAAAAATGGDDSESVALAAGEPANDNDASPEMSFALATITAAQGGASGVRHYGVEYSPSVDTFKLLGDAALTVFLVPQHNHVFKSAETAALLVRTVSAMLAGMVAELVVVCQTAGETKRLQASAVDRMSDSSVWAVQLPPNLTMAAKFDALLTLSRSLDLKRVAFVPWRDRQSVKEFRLGKFAALPTNESLARALRRMIAVLDFEQKSERADKEAVLKDVTTLLHLDWNAADLVNQARVVAEAIREEVGEGETFTVSAKNAAAREAVSRLKSLLSDTITVSEKGGVISGAVIKAAKVQAAMQAPMRAAAVALVDEGVKPVADADNLSSHSSFGSACTTKTLGVLVIDVAALGARGSFGAGDRWKWWFPHRRLFKVADFVLKEKAVVGSHAKKN